MGALRRKMAILIQVLHPPCGDVHYYYYIIISSIEYWTYGYEPAYF